MPWTNANPPKVALHWSPEQKKRCVAAANRALQAGKSDREAIFACIGAAGMGRKQEDDDYDVAVSDALAGFQDLMEQYFAGAITIEVLRSRFEQALEIHFTRLMTLGLDGREPTESDLLFLNGKLDEHSSLLGAFMVDLENGAITENRALWRAGLYATDREAYIYYTVPSGVVALMPGLPGEICAGNGLCGCSLDVYFDAEGNVSVYWVVNPEKESCEVCLDMAANSPYLFTREELGG